MCSFLLPIFYVQTREERKMEAIMKAFEKMARREERRKEALARLDKKHDVKVCTFWLFISYNHVHYPNPLYIFATH